MAKKKGLGKGLGALLTDDGPSIDSEKITEVKIIDIEPDSGQPRKVFEDEKLAELADSIRQYGVLTPILVHESENGYYKIIAGERRWRASKLAGLKSMPVIIKKLSDEEKYEVSLIENLQRQDLNPVEEALGLKKLMEEHGLTQEQVAEKLSRSRSSVANSLRLLNLQGEVVEMLEDGKISVGHAKVLLSVEDESKQLELALAVFEKGLSVRELESLIKSLTKTSKPKEKTNLNVKLAFETIEKSVASALGTKVKIVDKNNKGKIQIEYYSAEDLERIVNLIQKAEKNDL